MKKISILVIACLIISYTVTAQACFSDQIITSYFTGTSPASITIGDFNGDGKMDIATANKNSSNVGILLAASLGSFYSATNFSVGSFPGSIICADLNGDGNLDLVTTNYNSNISVLLGNGSGSFAAATSFSVGFDPRSVTCADFNGDGKLDLVTANYGSDNLSILIGNGAGGFSPAINLPAGLHPQSIVSADFDGDGKVDIATVNISANVSVRLGDGLGGFSAATDYTAGTGPYSVICADFNMDGKIDLATVNKFSDNVSVLLGNGSGGFFTATNYTVGSNPVSLISSDFNGDGNLDLVVTNNSSNDLSVLYGNGSGGFSTAINFFGGQTNPCSVVSGDFNGDSKQDIAVIFSGHNVVSILFRLFNFTYTKTLVSCAGGNNGTATVTVICGRPPYSYAWNTNPVQTTATATGLSIGTYVVTVTDADNATDSAFVTIYQVPSLSAATSYTVTNKCSGVCNGTATAMNVSGGTAPYSYEWNALANNQTTPTATGLCGGDYSVIIRDANQCAITKYLSITPVSNINSQVFLTNLAAVDMVNVSPAFSAYYSYSLPANINVNPSNTRNFVDPGKKARFKVECTNHKANGLSIVSGICKVRSSSPYITITDSSSALNNIGYNNFVWSADEFEIDINPNIPAGKNAYIDFVVQENGQDYTTTCVAIPITPLVYSPTTQLTIDDDNNPDSHGNDNDICEPNEIIEFYPWLNNISNLNAEYVRGRFENLDNLSFINIWNGVPGVGTTVYDATWWNYSFGIPQTINANLSNTTPEFDFVFDYNNSNIINNFKLYLVMASGFKLFPGNALSLVQWSLPYTFNNTGLTSTGTDAEKSELIKIYPNPCNGHVHLLMEDLNIQRLEIYNPMGALVLRTEELSPDLDLSCLSKGMYLLQFHSVDKVIYKKLILQ